MRAALAGKAPEAALARVRNPAGLDLGARLPEEIALSILAEMVKVRRQAPARESREAAAPAGPDAVDPVCGMSVRREGARHQARHEGRDFFFCCAGCRERFLADPGRYLVAAARP
jgi:xanthine dehydrogenase accessory factor